MEEEALVVPRIEGDDVELGSLPILIEIEHQAVLAHADVSPDLLLQAGDLQIPVLGHVR